MDKSDLKTGHILEFNNEAKLALVLRNDAFHEEDLLLYDKGYDFMSLLSNDLTWNSAYSANRKVIKVYKTDTYGVGTDSILDIDTLRTHLVWERRPEISIDIKINGKDAKLSDVSEETLVKLRNEN